MKSNTPCKICGAQVNVIYAWGGNFCKRRLGPLWQTALDEIMKNKIK